MPVSKLRPQVLVPDPNSPKLFPITVARSAPLKSCLSPEAIRSHYLGLASQGRFLHRSLHMCSQLLLYTWQLTTLIAQIRWSWRLFHACPAELRVNAGHSFWSLTWRCSSPLTQIRILEQPKRAFRRNKYWPALPNMRSTTSRLDCIASHPM